MFDFLESAVSWHRSDGFYDCRGLDSWRFCDILCRVRNVAGYAKGSLCRHHTASEWSVDVTDRSKPDRRDFGISPWEVLSGD